MISVKAHGIADYFVAIFLILSPFAFGLSNIPEARLVFIGLGSALLTYSLLTRYQVSILKVLPIPGHMDIDIFGGLFIILAPSLLHYRSLLTPSQFAFHVVLGVFMIGFVGVTAYRHDDGIAATKTTLESGRLHFHP